MPKTAAKMSCRTMIWKKPRERSAFFILAIGVLLACNAEDGEKPNEQPPNVVFVVIDTLRADRVGAFGGNVATPNIDSLAKSGVRFMQTFSNIPITGPSHATMFTGLLPLRHGVRNNTQILASDFLTVSEVFKQRGYQTVATVSLGNLGRKFGFAQGFDLYDDTFTTEWFRPADQITDSAIRLVADSDVGRPLFLFLHYSDPHEPYGPPTMQFPEVGAYLDGQIVGTVRADGYGKRLDLTVESGSHILTFLREGLHTGTTWRLLFRHLGILGSDQVELTLDKGWISDTARSPEKLEISRLPAAVVVRNSGEQAARVTLKFFVEEEISVEEARKRYDLEVEYVDQEIGRFLSFMGDIGRLSNTVFLLTSDHGEGLGDHGLLGHIHQLYETLLHVPLVVSGVGIERPATVETPVSLAGVGSLLLDLAGIEQPEPFSRVSPMSADSGLEVEILAMTFGPEAKRDLYAFIDGRRKVIAGPPFYRYEVYDLQADPLEMNDLYPSTQDARIALNQLVRIAAQREDVSADAYDLEEDEKQKLEALGYVH